MTRERSRHARSILTLEIAAVAVVAGCQWLGHYANFSAATDAGSPSSCAALGIRDKSGLHGSNLLLIDDPTGGCFWMDAYEATVADYQAWLSDLAGGMPAWDQTQCGWKTPEGGAPISPFDPASWTQDECVVPMNETDPFDPLKPVRCVDWCEADAFCRWAGKRLCFGKDEFSQSFTPRGQRDEWGLACSAGETQAYPFDTSTPTVCNIEQSTACSGNIGAGCGPYEETIQGLLDCRPADGFPTNLAGNVAEWVDLCTTEQAPNMCQYTGGAYSSSLSAVACATSRVFAPQSQRDETVGFRCCASLTPDELQAIGQ